MWSSNRSVLRCLAADRLAALGLAGLCPADAEAAMARWRRAGVARSASRRAAFRTVRGAKPLSLPSDLLAALGVGPAESLTRIPTSTLIAPRWYPAGVGEHLGEVHEVPGHEGRVAIGEVILRTPRARIEVRRAGTGFADPTGVGLGWDRVPDVLQRVQDVAGAVLDAVLVSGDEAARHPTVVFVLPIAVEQVRVGVQALDALLGNRAVVAQPYRSSNHQDVGREDPFLYWW